MFFLLHIFHWDIVKLFFTLTLHIIIYQQQMKVKTLSREEDKSKAIHHKCRIIGIMSQCNLVMLPKKRQFKQLKDIERTKFTQQLEEEQLQRQIHNQREMNYDEIYHKVRRNNMKLAKRYKSEKAISFPQNLHRYHQRPDEAIQGFDKSREWNKALSRYSKNHLPSNASSCQPTKESVFKASTQKKTRITVDDLKLQKSRAEMILNMTTVRKVVIAKNKKEVKKRILSKQTKITNNGCR